MVTSVNFRAAVNRAQQRAQELGIDLTALTEQVRDHSPDELNSATAKLGRRDFLESQHGANLIGDRSFERIIAGNELQPANFLARGELAAKPVMRIVLRTAGGGLIGYGTGFLVGDGVLITNNHVLPDRDTARFAQAEGYYELDIDGTARTTLRFALEPDRLYFTSTALDFTLVAVAPQDRGSGQSLRQLGWLPLIGGTGKVLEGEWLTIIQHPRGEQKQLCVRENQLLKRDTDVLWYSTDTLGGSSGSPVFNNDWLVVALHHSGVPEIKNGRWQTMDGRDFDPDTDSEDKIKWVANEGIRVSRIIATLQANQAIADHPMVKRMLNLTTEDLQSGLPVLGAAPTRSAPPVPQNGALLNPISTPTDAPREARMTQYVTVTLAIDDNGQVRIADSAPAREAALGAETAKPAKAVIEAPVVPEKDWLTGYDPTFLSPDHIVNLPNVERAALKKQIVPLLPKSVYGHPAPDAPTASAGVLHYSGYSVVMRADRRIAFFSAANINGGVEFPGLGRKDKWLFDDRIDRKFQINNDFYTRNKLDRGHLTRREDMEWGIDPVDATRRANGTCTWTNCSPQHEMFNQDKGPDRAVRLWGGLEKFILEQTARHYQFRVQAFTGPIFGDFDPDYRGVKIPLDYWKVVVAIDAEDRLFATGYVLTQRDVLDVTNLDEAAIAVPFGQFQTYQRPISEIEDATGLAFTYGGPQRKSLRTVDPLAKELAKPVWKRKKQRRGGDGPEESGMIDSPVDPDTPLSGHGNIVLESF